MTHLCRRLVLLAAAGLFACAGAFAQESADAFPSRTVRIVVPFPPGGGSDTFSRLLAQKLSARLRQSVIVENRPGGSTVIGGTLVARAPADGYTVFVATFINSIVPILQVPGTWDIRKDLEPVSLLTTNAYVLVVNSEFPARSVSELLALSKATPEGLSYASQGSGTPGHLAGELLKSLTGAKLVHIPYQGTAPSINAVLANQVPITFGNTFGTLPHIRAGKFRPLAVTGPTRTSLLTDVPTMKEAGVPGFEVVGWYGWMVPAGTPAPIVAKLRREVLDAMGEPEVKRFIDNEGSAVAGGTPAEFATFIKDEIAKWTNAVKASGVKLE